MRQHVARVAYVVVSVLMVTSLTYYQAFSRLPAPEKNGRDESAPVENGIARERAAVHKNETVYVVLDSAGTVTDQRVVNWIYDSEDGSREQVVDYGRYDYVHEMKAGQAPAIVEEDAVVWEQTALAAGDIFYEGITGKDLPVDIEIAYHLDGEPVALAALAGRSGNLKITVRLKNNLVVEGPVSYVDYSGSRVSREDTNYVPLLVQGTFTLDLAKYSEIRADDAGKVVIGETMNVAFTAFPYPDGEMVLEAQAEEIELAPVMFTIIPRMPPLPEVDLEDDFTGFLDGVTRMGDALMRIYDGVQASIEGLEYFRLQAGEMIAYAGALYERFAKMAGFAEEILSEIDLDVLMELLEQAERWLDLLEQLIGDGERLLELLGYLFDRLFPVFVEIEALNETGVALGDDLRRLQSVNDALSQHASDLMEENEAGSELYELGALILSQDQIVNSLSESGSALERGLNSVHAGLTGVEAGFADLEQAGDGDLEEAVRRLQLMLAQLADLQPGELLGQLRVLLKQIDDLSGDLAELEQLFDDLATIPEALDELIEGQERIAASLKAVHDGGIAPMEKGLIDAINEMRFGKAKTEQMRLLADDYRSFVDNQRNRYSRVQFILQTGRIAAAAVEEEQSAAAPEELSFWDKFVNLFSGDSSP